MNKKKIIFKTAIRLFAAQGYEATTTLQVAREVGVTEPAVFYYYSGKDTLFSAVLEEASTSYLKYIESVDLSRSTAFECLEALIGAHFSIVAREPEFMRILLQTCPPRFDDPENTCTKIYRQARSNLKDTTKKILKKGVASREFIKVDLEATANMLIALLNGLMHQQIAGVNKLKGVEAATIQFRRNALLVRK